MPKVSVIVPVYNAEPYLRECMESIVRQTLKDIEIICVNDGSTDGSPAILKEYAARDGRIVQVDKENGGYGLAMNTGLDRATGEYIGIVEPDDFVALTMFEDLYNTAGEHDLDLVKADFYRFRYEGDNHIFTYVRLSDDPRDYRTVFKPTERLSSFTWEMNTWAGIYRRSFLEEKGIRHHETPGAAFQDIGFFFQTFMYAERAMILDRACYRCRRDNPNSSVNNPAKVYAVNKEYDWVRGLIEREPGMWDRLKAVYWRRRNHSYYITMKRIAPECLDAYQERIGKELKEGYDRGEFGETDFIEKEWRVAKDLMEGRKPEIRRDGVKPAAPAKGDLEVIMNSASFRIGRAITWLPRKVRDLAGKKGTN